MTDNTKAIRALLQVEIDTGIAYRQARGQKFLELVREGDLHPVIWKKLEMPGVTEEVYRSGGGAQDEVGLGGGVQAAAETVAMGGHGRKPQ